MEAVQGARIAQIAHTDDLLRPSVERRVVVRPKPIGWQFDWIRLEQEVLQPTRAGRPARHQRYDWITDQLAEWCTVWADGLLIVEGIFALRQEPSSYYNPPFWVECSRDLRLQRGQARDGEQAALQWEEDWMKEEDRYIGAQRPHLNVRKSILGMPA